MHCLKTYHFERVSSFVKRDDELGFGITGSKLRKLLSLIPFLRRKNVKEVVVIGGAYSNHVVGICQLLIENTMRPILFLLGNESYERRGNLLLTSLLVEPENIHWVSRDRWQKILKIAEDYTSNKNDCFIIPEGAFMPEALPGALTLAHDIILNEQEINQKFDHVFMESGTGLMAIATILAFAWLDKKTCVHALLLADNEDIFIEKLKTYKITFEKLFSTTLEWTVIESQFKLYKPQQAKSFGSTNKAIFNTIKDIARTEGFLTDPIYSAKLFLEAKHIIAQEQIKGNALIIHSGGGLALMKFQEDLGKMI